MTKLSIYTILTARCLALLLGFALALPFWIINVFSLLLETVTHGYLSALLSFVASTRDVLTHFDNQLNNNNK